nr:MAG TPA: hypothetical protein [Caudoviricetes sp.]
MENKQVTYFEAVYQNHLEQHYVDSTADFENWVKVLKTFDVDTDVCYIAYDDGSVEDGAFLR